MQVEELAERIEEEIFNWAGPEDDWLGWHDYLKEEYAADNALDVFVVLTFDFSGLTRLWTHVILEPGEWTPDDYAGKLALASAEDLLNRPEPERGIVPENLNYAYLDDWE